jgi:hypothetical protein
VAEKYARPEVCTRVGFEPLVAKMAEWASGATVDEDDASVCPLAVLLVGGLPHHRMDDGDVDRLASRTCQTKAKEV